MNCASAMATTELAVNYTHPRQRSSHVPDTATFPDPPQSVRLARERFGHLSIVFAPMFLDERGIGSIAIMRQPARAFTDAEIALLASFTDQAAIAVQNARMFAALQARNEEITEALRREEAGSRKQEARFCGKSARRPRNWMKRCRPSPMPRRGSRVSSQLYGSSMDRTRCCEACGRPRVITSICTSGSGSRSTRPG